MKKSLLILMFTTLLMFACDSGSALKSELRKRAGIQRTIGLQPYGSFPASHVDTVKSALSKAYGMKVIILPARGLPPSAFIDVKSPRYRADSLLRDLKRQRPDSVDYLLGLTSSDISTSKRDKYGRIKEPASKYADFGIFGLGYKPGPTCIVSTYRLKGSSYKLFTDRLKKVCIHELGHNLGLNHCPVEGCVMQDACETIRTVDSANFGFCPECRKHID